MLFREFSTSAQPFNVMSFRNLWHIGKGPSSAELAGAIVFRLQFARQFAASGKVFSKHLFLCDGKRAFSADVLASVAALSMGSSTRPAA